MPCDGHRLDRRHDFFLSALGDCERNAAPDISDHVDGACRERLLARRAAAEGRDLHLQSGVFKITEFLCGENRRGKEVRGSKSDPDAVIR